MWKIFKKNVDLYVILLKKFEKVSSFKFIMLNKVGVKAYFSIHPRQTINQFSSSFWYVAVVFITVNTKFHLKLKLADVRETKKPIVQNQIGILDTISNASQIFS